MVNIRYGAVSDLRHFFSHRALQVIEKSARAAVDAAIEFAKTSPEPSREYIYQNIYSPGSGKGVEVRGVDAGSIHVLPN